MSFTLFVSLPEDVYVRDGHLNQLLLTTGPS